MNDQTLPSIDMKHCTHCGACAAACPEQALAMVDMRPIFVHPQDCTYCSICESVCPTGAIRCAFTVAWDTDNNGGTNHE